LIHEKRRGEASERRRGEIETEIEGKWEREETLVV
jgi:hypothetical protein